LELSIDKKGEPTMGILAKEKTGAIDMEKEPTKKKN
jgi:hypothetical protein